MKKKQNHQLGKFFFTTILFTAACVDNAIYWYNIKNWEKVETRGGLFLQMLF